MWKGIYSVCLLLISLVVEGQEAKLSLQTGHSASINKLCFSHDGNLLASASSDNAVILWSVKSGKQLMVFTGHKLKVNALAFHPSDSFVVSCSDDKSVKIWNVREASCSNTFTFPNEVKSVLYSPDGKKLLVGAKQLFEINELGPTSLLTPKANNYIHTLAFNSDASVIAVGGKKGALSLFSFPQLSVLHKYKLKTNQVKFSADNTTLVAAGVRGKLKKWRLNSSILSSSTFTAERIWQSYLSVAISEHYFVGGNKNNLINVYAIKNGRKIKVLNGHDNAVVALDINKNETILASAGFDASIILWDMETWQILKILKGTADKVNAVAFSSNDAHLVLGYENGSFKYVELLPGGKIVSNQVNPSAYQRYFRRKMSIVSIDSILESTIVLKGCNIRRSRKDKKVRSAKVFLIDWNIVSNTFKTKKLGKVVFEKSDFFYLTSANVALDTLKSFVFPITPTLKNKVIESHTDRITCIDANSTNTILATSSHDGLVKIWDINSESLLLNFAACNEQDHIFITPENFYYSTKGALEHIGFRIGLSIYSFEQFDLLYNRPDLIIKSLQLKDTLLHAVYKQAYLKRSKRQSVLTKNVGSMEIPTVEISKGNFSATALKYFTFELLAQSNSSPLAKLFVLVNGVPSKGVNGISLKDSVSKKEVSLELSVGLNKIQYYVSNHNGVYSLKHTIEIFHKGKKEKPTLYLVCIGASKYRNSEFNLQYAEKDAMDLETFFKSSKKYASVQTKLFLNEKVTKQSLPEITAFLSSAGVDDIILITYAGHGLLDANLEYYLSTYDVNFLNPFENGLAFAEFEMLLEDLTCRNKMMVIDACHSGEIDKEEVEFSKNTTKTEGDIVFRNVGPTVAQKSSSRSTFELSKALFAESKNSHGAVIISSAGGGEYAIEGERWKNGIFTYCFIDALKNGKADLNNDGSIKVSELQLYLSKEVPSLTKGKQNPTSRVENISNNFKLW